MTEGGIRPPSPPSWGGLGGVSPVSAGRSTSCPVFDIARGSTHDGPGIRTTVFFKGCPLRCTWCQNPEGMSVEREVGWEATKCIRCLACVAACTASALSEGAEGLPRDRSVCTRCGACVEACPARAMEFTDREWTLDALLAEALKDREYYRASGGGVTVSGGEPLLRHGFVRAFFERLHAQAVHTTLDTCGLAPKAALAGVLAHTDHVLFDLKLMDPVLHEQFTGHSNRLILGNLLTVADMVRTSRGARRLWIRTPLIPGATATPDNVSRIGAFLCEHLADAVERWELCAFNNACLAKYQKLGLRWAFEGIPLMGRQAVEALRQSALSTGFDPQKMVVSGLTARASEGAACP